jgi:predicted dienelactone hydrolase
VSIDALGARGRFPVGVRTLSLTDPARDRTLPVELWYPAEQALAGADLVPASQDVYQVFRGLTRASQAALRDAAFAPLPAPAPLVMFSHGLGGHRRQSTFLCTHLASHGYLVVAPDHVGNTLTDAFGVFGRLHKTRDVNVLLDWVGKHVQHRPADLRFLMAALAGGAVSELVGRVDAAHVHLVGHSFGGWTCLAVGGHEPRVRSLVALAPAGGAGAYARDPLVAAIDLHWPRPVPTLFIIGEADSICPPAAVRELYARVPEPKQLIGLPGVDHMHFLDDAQKAHELFRLMPGMSLVPPAGPILEFADLAPAEPTHATLRGLVLAHLRANP